jgi:hypothetical protein
MGLPQKTGKITKDSDGSLDVYEYNQYGIPEKTKEIEKEDDWW